MKDIKELLVDVKLSLADKLSVARVALEISEVRVLSLCEELSVIDGVSVGSSDIKVLLIDVTPSLADKLSLARVTIDMNEVYGFSVDDNISLVGASVVIIVTRELLVDETVSLAAELPLADGPSFARVFIDVNDVGVLFVAEKRSLLEGSVGLMVANELLGDGIFSLDDDVSLI